jgi:hypothetical protein
MSLFGGAGECRLSERGLRSIRPALQNLFARFATIISGCGIGADATAAGGSRNRPKEKRATVCENEQSANRSTSAARRIKRRREPGKPTWRCLNRLSLSSAWLAPLNRGSINSAHIHGTDVPVEEPSTASILDVAASFDHLFLRNRRPLPQLDRSLGL